VSFDQNNGKDSEKVQVVEHSSGQSSLHGQIFSKKWEDRINLDFYRPKNPFYPIPLRSPFFPIPMGNLPQLMQISELKSVVEVLPQKHKEIPQLPQALLLSLYHLQQQAVPISHVIVQVLLQSLETISMHIDLCSVPSTIKDRHLPLCLRKSASPVCSSNS
jgi:hypothetical protein